MSKVMAVQDGVKKECEIKYKMQKLQKLIWKTQQIGENSI